MQATDDETLLRPLLEHFGFSRLTKRRRDYLSKLLRLLRQPDPQSKPDEAV